MDILGNLYELPWPPVIDIAGPLPTIRGPTANPSQIAFRKSTARNGSHPTSRTLVNPASRVLHALPTANVACVSGLSLNEWISLYGQRVHLYAHFNYRFRVANHPSGEASNETCECDGAKLATTVMREQTGISRLAAASQLVLRKCRIVVIEK